jgi:hypothetical protein
MVAESGSGGADQPVGGLVTRSQTCNPETGPRLLPVIRDTCCLGLIDCDHHCRHDRDARQQMGPQLRADRLGAVQRSEGRHSHPLREKVAVLFSWTSEATCARPLAGASHWRIRHRTLTPR